MADLNIFKAALSLNGSAIPFTGYMLLLAENQDVIRCHQGETELISKDITAWELKDRGMESGTAVGDQKQFHPYQMSGKDKKNGTFHNY